MTPRIGIVGTFDVANYGDLLFPLLAEHELRERLGELELVRYSYGAAGDWPYAVTPLEALPGDLPELGLLLVGGGHLVRFDKGVAPGYGPLSPGIHHPTGYWLGPSLAAAAAGVPVAWNAVGVSPDPPAWARPLLRAGLESADYVAVREGAGELLEIAPGVEIHLVPDTAFCVDRLLRGDAGAEADALLRGAGIDGPYAIVQPSPSLVQHRAAIERVLGSGHAVLELPAGPVLGDGPDVLSLDIPVARLEAWPSPFVVTELVARADAVVAISLHLSIAAAVLGVPLLRPRAAEAKYTLVDGLPGVEALEPATTIPSRAPGDEIRVRAQAVQRHWDAVAALVGAPRRWRPAASATFLDAAGSYEGEAAAEDEVAAAHGREERLEADVAALHATVETTRAELDHAVQAHSHAVDELRAVERAAAEEAVRSQQEEARLRVRLHELGVVLDETHRALDALIAQEQRRLRPRLRRRALAVGRRVWWRLPRRVRDDLRRRIFGADAGAPHVARAPAHVPRRVRPAAPIRSSISVIVPTLNGGPLFDRVLASLAAQRGIGELELLVADSGSTDGTPERAEAAGARVIEIPPGEFGHGRTRNLAAGQASGDILLMLVQDAVLLGAHVLRHLALELEDDASVFAACARQIPRTDADLYAALVVTAHDRVMRQALASARDRPRGALSPVERRALGAMDDVCAALRRSAWDELRFADVEFAEDLELGLRAVRRGWRVALPDDAAVAHSHTRGATYHFRRGIADRLYVAAIVGDDQLSETSGTSYPRLAAALRALLGEVAGALETLGPEARPLSVWLALLVSTLVQGPHPAPLGPELAAVATLLPSSEEDDLDPAVLSASRTELLRSLEWGELTRFAESQPAVDAARAGDLVAKLAAAHAGHLVGDHLRREKREDVERVLLTGV
jgi:lipopolysaccharide transport system ATP-binding protein